MAKKVLYLGSGKWCWTEQCKIHSKVITQKNEYMAAVAAGDEVKIVESMTALIASPEGLNTYRYLRVAEMEKTLGHKPTLGLDLDGTTGDFTHGLRTYMGETLKIEKTQWLKKFPDPSEYAMWKGDEAWYTDKDDFTGHFHKSEGEGLYTKIPIFDYAPQTLAELKNYGFNITVVTARNIAFTKDTRQWIKQHKIPTKTVLHLGIEKEKAPNISLYIDDSPEVIQRLIDKEKKVLIMNQLYNENLENHKNSRRTKGWGASMVNSIFELFDERNSNKDSK
jgi:uncharacterized HAD superfamily protein